MATQLDLRLPARAPSFSHGGARRGAGRKKKTVKDGYVPHVPRPSLNRHTPVHVTMRAGAGVPSLRAERIFRLITAEIGRANGGEFRTLHFSVQTDHVHLIVEARDRGRLWRVLQRLASRIARGVNGRTGHRGYVWRHRYHRQDLGSPRQVRNALVYVLFNIRKHDASHGHRELRMAVLDPCSSARWFDGFDPRVRPLPVGHVRGWSDEPIASAVMPPKSWLARTGWKKHGLLKPTETPKSPA